MIKDRREKSNYLHNIHNNTAFTLVEMVIVIVIISLVAAAILKPSQGSFSYWQQEGAIRKLSEQINFLYNQAITDGITYRIEFDLSSQRQSYRIVQVSAPIDDLENNLTSNPTISGNLTGSKMISQEIENFLNPLPAEFGSAMPPENIPSLAEPFYLPDGMFFEDLRTMRGDYTTSSVDDFPYLDFSPRGYAEFLVIHLKLVRSDDSFVTLVVNPFTGLTDIYREYKQFEWSYGRT